MRPITFVSQLCLLLIPASVHAQSCSTSTGRSCATKMAMVPNWWPVGTTIKTTTAPATTQAGSAVSTVTATTTVSAPPLTATVSTTIVVTSTTTATPQTNTIFLTSTQFSTTSITTTTTTTGRVTTTVVKTATNLQTSLIPAPSNFIDVYNSTNDTTYAGGQRSIGRRRDLRARLEHDKRGQLHDFLSALLGGIVPSSTHTKSPTSKKKPMALGDFNNPVAVTCTVTVQKYCGVAKATTVLVTATGTPTTTTKVITSTITSVSTKVPAAVTVTKFSSTVTSTLTQITTIATGSVSTVTQASTTTLSSTTTVYAACATSNMLGSRIQSGNAIKKTYIYDDAAVVTNSMQSSAYDCCVACQTGNLCQFYQYSGSTGTCILTGQDSNWCPNGQQDAGWPAAFVWDDPSKVTDALIIGNGPCGTTMDIGQDQGL